MNIRPSSADRDLLLDRAIDELIEGKSGATMQQLPAEERALIFVARQVQHSLADAPPPPHGLRPGRSAFLTAAAESAARQASASRGGRLNRLLAWAAPAFAVLVLAALLTFMWRGDFPLGPPVVQPLAPSQPQSDTPLLFPPPTNTPTPSPTPTSTPTPSPTPSPTPAPTETPTPSPTPAHSASGD